MDLRVDMVRAYSRWIRGGLAWGIDPQLLDDNSELLAVTRETLRRTELELSEQEMVRARLDEERQMMLTRIQSQMRASAARSQALCAQHDKLAGSLAATAAARRASVPASAASEPGGPVAQGTAAAGAVVQPHLPHSLTSTLAGKPAPVMRQDPPIPRRDPMDPNSPVSTGGALADAILTAMVASGQPMRLAQIHDAVAAAGLLAGKDTIRARMSRLMADGFVHHRQQHGYSLGGMTDMAKAGSRQRVRYMLPDGTVLRERLTEWVHNIGSDGTDAADLAHRSFCVCGYVMDLGVCQFKMRSSVE